MQNPRANGTASAKVIQVIQTVSKRGIGTKEDPVRDITQYWDFEGKLLAEYDSEYLYPLIEYENKAIKESLEHMTGPSCEHGANDFTPEDSSGTKYCCLSNSTGPSQANQQ